MSHDRHDNLKEEREARKSRHPEHFTPLTSAIKHDQGKPQISLIPSEAILEMAKGFTYGANKYGRKNYEAGMNHSRLLDAALRHLLAVSSGDYTDSESGNSHLSHAMASLAMLIYMQKHHPQLDDIKSNNNQEEKQGNKYNDVW